MKRFFKHITLFFGFTTSERRGIVVLLGILSFLMMGIQLVPHDDEDELPNISSDIFAQRSSNHSSENRMNTGDTSRSNYQRYTSQSQSYSSHKSSYSSSSSEEKPRFQVREKKVFTVQANTCDTLDLQQIRGIGSKTSNNIVKYREKLGGFVRKEQLLEVWGIDSARFEQIQAAFIIDKKNIRKLNLNTATIKDLQKHPYLDYYQAKAIVQNRDNQGLYNDISDILKLALIDTETFNLIKDYLEI